MLPIGGRTPMWLRSLQINHYKMYVYGVCDAIESIYLCCANWLVICKMLYCVCFSFCQSNHEFSLTLRKDRKYDTIKLSSEFRNVILTSLFKYHKDFAEKIKTEVSNWWTILSVHDFLWDSMILFRNIRHTNIIGPALDCPRNWKWHHVH